jgi:sulfide:quinone oxidoreductase
VTAEPFLGHFGIGGLPGGERLLGMFLKHTGIQAILDTAIQEAVPGELRLADHRQLPFHYAVVVPPFVGAEVVRTSGLGNASGFVEVEDTYQTKGFPNIYAVGIGTAVSVPWQTANPVGVPKTGFPAETMAHVPPPTSPPRSAVSSRPSASHSPRCRRSALWTLATTGW